VEIEILADRSDRVPRRPEILVLKPDNWNDYGYTTLYDLFFVDQQSSLISLGGVKVAYKGYGGEGRPLAVGRFLGLGDRFFSIGQDTNYYETIRELGDERRIDILTTLRDIAYDPAILESVRNEDVTEQSLFRSINVFIVEGQFRRIARGGKTLIDYKFEYMFPNPLRLPEVPSLTVEVDPEANPPTNLHVLIGRNGVGKTTLLKNLALALLEPALGTRTIGRVSSRSGERVPFVNVVMVAFSAFDPFEEFGISTESFSGVNFSHVGLPRQDMSVSGVSPKAESAVSLVDQFIDSLSAVISEKKLARWLTSIRGLRSDPLFTSYGFDGLVEDMQAALPESSDTLKQALDTNLREPFESLSSGHKAVLLTITRLVEKVAEKTLVLLDEPESHLHPPLLSALLRSLSELMIDRNGVSLIATHSPVVLQEVPARCVSKLRRYGEIISVERPTIETFGENVGVLTHDVFGLEVTSSGFHKELRDAVTNHSTYEEVLAHFGGTLGGEARGIARILLAEKNYG
jgi:predicted ATPase